MNYRDQLQNNSWISAINRLSFTAGLYIYFGEVIYSTGKMLFVRPQEGRGTTGEKEVLLVLLEEASLLDSEGDSKINISQSYKFGESSRKITLFFF